MLPEFKRSRRKIIFRVETYPLAGILLCCLYCILVSGRIDFSVRTDNIRFPDSYGDGVIRCFPYSPCVIYITKNNRVYLDIEDEEIREKLLLKVGNFYNKSFSDEELDFFAKGFYFGDDIHSFKVSDSKFHKVHKGVPLTASDNQLLIWVKFIKEISPEHHFQLVADENINFKEINKVFKTLQANDVKRISLMTNFVQSKN